MLKTLCLILAAAATPAFGQSSRQEAPVPGPGVHARALSVGNMTVGYTISIPPTYSAGEPVPLILALHFGGNPTGAGNRLLGLLMGPALEELGAIIVAPDSVRGQWDTPENDRAVNALIEGVLKNYNVDKRKIAVAGFSMGGAGVWHFAGKYPELFSAAIPVAGRPPASPEGWRTPVFAVHSRADEVVPIGPAEARIAELQKAGVRAEIVVLDGITHYETNRFVDGLRRAIPWLKDTWR